jgi:hypothetical protein
MFSFGMFSRFADSTTSRSLKLESGLPLPSLVAIVIALAALVKAAPRLTSATPFCLFICDHLE